MACKIERSESTFSLYHREYENDLKPSGTFGQSFSWNQGCRVARVALPYITLYPPLSKPISILLGAIRSIHSLADVVVAFKAGDSRAISHAVLESAIAVISVAGSIFAHPVGMIITTGHDITIAIAKLISAIQQGNHSAMTEALVQILNNSVYLALLCTGSIELLIASTVLQAAHAAYQSRIQFKEGMYLEAVGNLGMALVRGAQTSGQIRAAIRIQQLKHEAKSRAAEAAAESRSSASPQTPQEAHCKAVSTDSMEEVPATAKTGRTEPHEQNDQAKAVSTSKTKVVSRAQSSNSKTIETNVITRERGADGVVYYIGWYVDGSIITALDGVQAGKQVVIVNGDVVGVANNFVLLNGVVVHTYVWGRVYSYPNRQVVNFS